MDQVAFENSPDNETPNGFLKIANKKKEQRLKEKKAISDQMQDEINMFMSSSDGDVQIPSDDLVSL